MLKKIALVFTLAALATSVVSADILPFSWSTSGSFSTSPLAFGGVSAGSPLFTDASGNLLGISLGTITFPDVDTTFIGTFNLTVNFFQPDGTINNPFAGPFTVTTEIVGQHNDQLAIDFPAASLVSFSGTNGIGSFTFGIPDVTFMRTGNGQTRTVDLTGNILGATDAGPIRPRVPPFPSRAAAWCCCAPHWLGLGCYGTGNEARRFGAED